MSDKRAEKINDEIERQLEERGYVAIPDVLIGIGMLPEAKYNEWKIGNLRCLEDGCSADLSKLHNVLKAVKSYAEENGLKPSVVRYNADAKGALPLRFTMSNDPVRERLYSTHYLDPWQAQEIRRGRRK